MPAMVIKVCSPILGRVAGVTRCLSASTIRGASGPVRYNPQGSGRAKPSWRETCEDGTPAGAGVSHSQPLLPRWKQRAPKTDKEWGLRKKEEKKQYWDVQEDGMGTDASAELQRLKVEMKLRDSSTQAAPSAPSKRKTVLPIAAVEEREEDEEDDDEVDGEEEEVPAIAVRHPTFGNSGVFYGDGRKFEGLTPSSSSLEPAKKNSLQGSGLFYGDGRKFQGLKTDIVEDSAEDMLFEVEEDKTIANEKLAARNYSLRLLGMAPQTAHKLRQKLIGRNVSAPVIESTIADLQRCGLQSDLEYAMAFARSRWRSALWGPFRLKQELKLRGVCPEDVAIALEKVFTSGDDGAVHGVAETEADDDDDEREGALWGMTREARAHLVEKARLQWARGAGSVSAEARKRRMIGWLQRRGFNWSITSHILKTLESQDKNSQ